MVLFRFSCSRIDPYKRAQSEHTNPDLVLRIYFDVVKLRIAIPWCRWLSRNVIPSFDRILRISGGQRDFVFLELFPFHIEFPDRITGTPDVSFGIHCRSVSAEFSVGNVVRGDFAGFGIHRGQVGPIRQSHPDQSVLAHHSGVRMGSGVLVEFLWADLETRDLVCSKTSFTEPNMALRVDQDAMRHTLEPRRDRVLADCRA